jgi:hypothetical protein
VNRDLKRRVRKIETDRNVTGAVRYAVSHVPLNRVPTPGDDGPRRILTDAEWEAKYCEPTPRAH